MNSTVGPNTLYLTVEQVAERLGVSTDSIWRWKRAGKFPKAVKVGPGSTRWRLADIETYEGQMQACLAVDASFVLDTPFVKNVLAKGDGEASD
jgi:prophage regulatory protein